MANKKSKGSDMFQTAEQLKEGVATLNQEAIQMTDKLVDSSIKTAGKWQKVMAKGMLAGVHMFGKQQELVFNVLEELKGQYKYSNKRIQRLLDTSAQPVEVAKTKTATVKAASKKAKPSTKTKPSAQKVKKAVLAGAENKKDDLKMIDGIGPKIASLLQTAGISTFYQLSIAKVKDLEVILASAGSAYKSNDPKPWIAQAKKLATTKMKKA